jgi:hypothetical protein
LKEVIKTVSCVLMIRVLISLRGSFFIMPIQKRICIERIISFRDVNPNGIFPKETFFSKTFARRKDFIDFSFEMALFIFTRNVKHFYYIKLYFLAYVNTATIHYYGKGLFNNLF